MKVAWNRLIRFVATDGRVLRGEPVLPHENFDLGSTTEETQLKAKVVIGDDLYDTSGATTVSNEIVTVQRLLGPLTPKDVDIIRCVGLNYAKHSEHQRHSTDVKTNQLQSAKLAEHHHLFLLSSSSPTRACMTTT